VKFYILSRLYVLGSLAGLLWAMGMPDMAVLVPVTALVLEWFVYGLLALCVYCD
jgi:hypothetical protein